MLNRKGSKRTHPGHEQQEVMRLQFLSAGAAMRQSAYSEHLSREQMAALMGAWQAGLT
jgi:hypothetical protein